MKTGLDRIKRKNDDKSKERVSTYTLR